MVTIKQNRTNLTSQTFEKSTVARSSNTKTGKGTIKTNLFIFEAKISSIHPIFLKTSPKIIIKKEEGKERVDAYGDEAQYKTPLENPFVLELLERLGYDSVENFLENSEILTRNFGE